MQDTKKSGQDLTLGDVCSQTAYYWAKKTFINRSNQYGTPSKDLEASFSQLLDYGAFYLAMASDGIGTKIEIAERVQRYDTLGFDLVAMVADDIICSGAEPVNLSNILDVDFLDQKIVDQLMNGLCQAAGTAGIAVSGGEIAELGTRIGGYGEEMHFNWCATAVGLLSKDKQPITGALIQEGNVILALKSRGLRSNGFSSARHIMQSNYGPLWHHKLYDETRHWGDVLLTPSLIYTPIIKQVLASKFPILGMAHITGGGIKDNLARILKKKALGAILDNLFEPHSFMLQLQDLGKLSDDKAYNYWNMGNALMMVVHSENETEILDILNQGEYQAQRVGYIQKNRTISIKSKGLHSGELKYNV